MRGVWKLSSPPKSGEGTCWPFRSLLPCSHSDTAVSLVSESLRRWNSMSLDSISTSTLNRSLVMPGTIAPGPPTRPSTTSVGNGIASSSTGRLGSESSVGMWLADQRLGQPAEVRQAVGHREDQHARRAGREARLDGVQRLGQRGLVGSRRRAGQHDRQEQGVDGRELRGDVTRAVVEDLRRVDEGAQIELDIGECGGVAAVGRRLGAQPIRSNSTAWETRSAVAPPPLSADRRLSSTPFSCAASMSFPPWDDGAAVGDGHRSGRDVQARTPASPPAVPCAPAPARSRPAESRCISPGSAAGKRSQLASNLTRIVSASASMTILSSSERTTRDVRLPTTDPLL